MGYLYQRKQKNGTTSGMYWCKYYVNGRPIRESTGTTKEREARRFLKEREGRVATGQPILPRTDRILYDEIASDLQQHYEASGERDLTEAHHRLNHLNRFFKGYRVGRIGPTEAVNYVRTRQASGVSNGTINRELAMLMKMLRLAYERGKVIRLPVIHKLKEPPPRQGFFEEDQFQAVRKHLPVHLQLAVTIAHTYGWRMQSEVLTLERQHLDLEAGMLRLDPGTTKNGDDRLVYLTPELKDLFRAQVARMDELVWELGRIITYLFPKFTGHLRGERIKDFKKAWKRACEKAGCPSMLRHDFRRTAVRNMVNKGDPERVAMTVTGHKSRSVFDRYHIVSPTDLQDVVKKLTGTPTGTQSLLPLDSPPVSMRIF